jgi:hypothetical protein
VVQAAAWAECTNLAVKLQFKGVSTQSGRPFFSGVTHKFILRARFRGSEESHRIPEFDLSRDGFRGDPEASCNDKRFPEMKNP